MCVYMSDISSFWPDSVGEEGQHPLKGSPVTAEGFILNASLKLTPHWYIVHHITEDALYFPCHCVCAVFNVGGIAENRSQEHEQSDDQAVNKEGRESKNAALWTSLTFHTQASLSSYDPVYLP